MRNFGIVEKSRTAECLPIPRSLITTIPNKEEIAMTNSTIPLSSDVIQPEIGNQQVTQIEIGWLAGFIDGEGYIGITEYKTRNRHVSYSCAIQISNTDEAMILKAQQIVQKIGVNPYIRTHGYGVRNMPKSKIVYVLVIHRMNKIIPVLELVNSHLTGLKKERGILILEYCQLRLQSFKPGSHYNIMTEREAQIIDLCIAKQKRGTSETTREAQLERSKLMLAKSYINKREYAKKREADPIHHARRIELQKTRRGTKEGREKEKEYRTALNIRRKDALRSVLN
jgi:hypothetical protein